MRRAFEMTEGERGGAVAGLNLFFAALLGANLGTIELNSVSEHIYLSVLLAGAVSGLFVAAVSSRRSTSISILAGYAILLTAIILMPEMSPIQIGPHFTSLVATLGVWTAFLLIMRVTPVITTNKPEALSLGDSVGAPGEAEDRDK